MSRYLYVFNTSPLISYQGQWSMLSDNASYVSPFNRTVMVNSLLSGSGSFTFNFVGTSVSVRASFISFNSTQPSWTCFIDGHALQNIPPSSNFSDVEICTSNVTIKTTPNNLTVVASSTTDNPFRFDYLRYVPDANTILDNATVVVKATDSQIQYNSDRWNILEGIAETSVEGASMTFDFVGIQITLISGFKGSPHLNASTVNSSAVYSIDNGTLIPFVVTVPSNEIQWITFQTPILSPGSHRLFIEYYGNNDNSNSSVPLTLEYFVIQNLTIPAKPPNRAGFKLSDGIIASIVMGCVVVALVIFVLIRWLIKEFKKAAGPEPLQIYTESEQLENLSIQESGQGFFANARNILITGGTFLFGAEVHSYRLFSSEKTSQENVS